MRFIFACCIVLACLIFFLIATGFGFFRLFDHDVKHTYSSTNIRSCPTSESIQTENPKVWSNIFVSDKIDDESKPTCGYHSCPKTHSGKLNVHVVPHTHDDVGWVKTVDEYYYGNDANIKEAGVRRIINNVVEALKVNPERRFIYVETAFLMKWWMEQNATKREEMQSLINQGRLEIIGGAWTMNDEATTHYQCIIDQFTWGFRRLRDAFGVCARPKIGWQVDPFGHSREQASLFAQFGFDGIFLGRIDYEDKRKRFKDKTTEFIWNGSSSLGAKSNLFSVVTYDGYYPPHGFCYDVLCNDDKLIDEHGNLKNISSKIRSFHEYLQEHARYYRTNNIIINMGGDFFYRDAEVWYSNLDVLIKYTNLFYGSKVNIFYSTPSCYIKSVNDAQMSWTDKSDDFLPYSTNSHEFWVGFFSSRPTLKFFERFGNNLLQVTKQLSVSSNIMDSKDLQKFRETMGIMQHHDAVTGTEKQHVAENYAQLMHNSMVEGSNIAAEAIRKKIKSKNHEGLRIELKFHSCLLLNTSSCDITETSKNFVAVVYNPTSFSVSTYTRIPVSGKSYRVTNSVGDKIITQLIPIAEPILRLPGRVSNATKELIFYAADIPAFGYTTFHIVDDTLESDMDYVNHETSSSSIGGEFYKITVDEEGGVVIHSKYHDVQVNQSFHYYPSRRGSARFAGAYISHPASAHDYKYSGNYKIFKGPLVQEIQLTINEYVSEVVRLYDGEDKIEFDWLIGPIPVNDGVSREIITRYSSNLASKKTFYTDSNGREIMKRVRDFRPTWNITVQEKISSNYYPVTTMMFLQDEMKNLRLSILNDRAQGGTSINDGQLELMLHRRLLHDDAFGVEEPLNERAFGEGLVVRGTHYLTASNLNDISYVALKEKSLSRSLALRSWIFFSSIDSADFKSMKNSYALKASALQKELPPNVHILTLEPWESDSILLRLEHTFEVNQAGDLSSPVEIDLFDLFADFRIISIAETTLDGNERIEHMTRLKWHNEFNNTNEEFTNHFKKVIIQNDHIKVLLQPMEIRTFIIIVNRKS